MAVLGVVDGERKFDVDNRTWFDPYTMMIKCGQHAVIENRPTLHLAVRVALGTAEQVAKLAAEGSWTSERPCLYGKALIWHKSFA